MFRKGLAAILLMLAASPLTAPFQTWHLPGAGVSLPRAVWSTPLLSTTTNVAEPAVRHLDRRQLGWAPFVPGTAASGFSTDSRPGAAPPVDDRLPADHLPPLVTILRI